MIDKIKCKNKIGTDIHSYLIAVLNKLSEGWIPPILNVLNFILQPFLFLFVLRLSFQHWHPLPTRLKGSPES